MRSRVALLGALCACVILVGGAAHAGAATSSELFFSEYIEGSSNNKALEIYNGTGAPVDLAANSYNVQMYFNGSASAGLTINLTGSVADGDVHVVAQSSAVAAILAQADQTNGAGWFNGDDAVVLRKGTTIVDVIGQIGFDPGAEWGTGLTSTADNTLRRKASITAGDASGADAFDPASEWDGFASDTFGGLGAHSVGPATLSVNDVSVSEGNAGTTPFGFTVNLSSPAGPGGVTFDIATVDNTATVADNDYYAQSLTGQTIPQGSSSYTFSVLVNGDTTTESDETFFVDVTNVTGADVTDGRGQGTIRNDDVACSAPATAIHDVQGSGVSSPLTGSTVEIEGIVVGDYQAAGQFGGFYVQEEDAEADANPLTSEGIFVFSPSAAVAPGDRVRVRGTVTEFANLTELTSVSATSVCSTGNSVTPTNVMLPVALVSDFERYEGMRVHFPQNLTATETFTLARFGEVRLAANGRLYTPTAVVAPGAPALALADENRRRSFVLDDGNNQQNIDPTIHPIGGLSASNTLRSGYTTTDLDGVFDERSGAYRVQPVAPVPFTATNPRTPSPDAVGGNLRVASFNVLNFFNGDGLGGGFPTSRGANTLTEFNRQLAKEVSALTGLNADIVGLMELENDASPNSAIEDLVNALNAAAAPGTYAFINTGIVGTDEIRVALIYKPASVTPVGAYKILDSSVDPRFIDTRNRPALAQTFAVNSSGRKLTVVVNHLKSKGSSCEDIGDPDTGDGQGACNLTRKHAVEAEIDWLATDPTGSGSTDFLIIGDMNSYTFEDPITTFTSAGYHNLIRDFHGLSAYSYVFGGESGYLDHAIASSSLAAKVTGATDWHINADEPVALDYNVEFKTANQVNTFYAPDAYRSSDHDPVVVGLSLLNAAPTAVAGGPYSVTEGGSVTLSATGNDPDGDALIYAWDLDNNGSFETAGQNVTFDASAIDGPDSRIVNVRATDPSADAGFDTTTVTINNADPSATFDAPASVSAGLPFTISLTNPSDPAAADTFTYAFNCGTGYGAFGTASSATCTAPISGPFTVRGTIKDDDGGVREYTASVDVGVTFDSLCDLTRVYVTNTEVEDGLCDKLDIAEAAAASGDTKETTNALSAYVKQVKAQTGKSLTAAQAKTLIELAGKL